MQRITPPLAGKVPDGWLNAAAAPFGAQYDDFSARIDPRATLAALKAHVDAQGQLREGVEVSRLERGRAVVANGNAISAGEIVVAAGFEAYALLQPFMGEMAARPGGRIGRGVKGQAVLVAFGHADDLPIVSADGAYVVPQAGGRVAIGSSNVDDWQEGEFPAPDEFNPADVGFYDKALTLVPALRDAPVVERWANVRPRNMLAGRGTEPFIGRVPGHGWLSARIGGFKIGLGVGHLADAMHTEYISK